MTPDAARPMLRLWAVVGEYGSFVRVALVILAICVGIYAIVQAFEGSLGFATLLAFLVLVVLLRVAGVIPARGLLSAALDRWRR